MKNYYKILGVSYSANSEAIRNAYRIKAKVYHPDISKGQDAKEKFQLINEAYQILKNDNKRRLYDHRLRIGLRQEYKVHNQPKYKTSPYTTKQQYYYAQRNKKPESGFKHEKLFDNIVFLFMTLIGLYLIGFGFYRLVYAPVDGVNSIAGIISGFVFTIVIVYAWLLKVKKQV